MFRKRPRLAASALLCAALQFVMGSGEALGLVMCWHSTGHVGIERTQGDDCCNDREGGTASAGVAPASHCDCTDTPILQDSMELRARHDDADTARTPQATALVVVASPRLPACAWRRLEAASPPSTLSVTSRRSIVLQV